MNSTERGRILLVDDEDGIRMTVEAILSDDFDVTGVSNVNEAIAKLETSSFDVVLTDYDMPGRSGLELLKTIAERFPDVLPIVLSGHANMPELAATETQRLAVRVIAKPYDPARLVKWVETTVRLSRMQQMTNKLQSRLKTKPPATKPAS